MPVVLQSLPRWATWLVPMLSRERVLAWKLSVPHLWRWDLDLQVSNRKQTQWREKMKRTTGTDSLKGAWLSEPRQAEHLPAPDAFCAEVLAERLKNFQHELLTRVDPGQVKHVNSQTGPPPSSALNLHSFPIPCGLHYTWNPLWKSHKCKNVSRKKKAHGLITDNLISAVFVRACVEHH